MRQKGPTPPRLTIQVGMTLREVERRLIAATLQHTWNNVRESSKLLGIDRSTPSTAKSGSTG